MPPAPRSELEEDHRLEVDSKLERFWRGLSGYGIGEEEEHAIAEAGGLTPVATQPGRKPATYGEVTAIGARQIGRALGVDGLDPTDGFVFMDLGSGLGKFVVQAYLEWPSVARAVGVELAPSRAGPAREAWAKLLASGEAAALRDAALSLPTAAAAADGGSLQVDDAVTLLEGDLFKTDVSEATHIYVASLCFGDDLLRKVSRKLAAEAKQLRAITTLRQFPLGVLGFEYAGKFEAAMSWTTSTGGGATTYLYKRRAGA